MSRYFVNYDDYIAIVHYFAEKRVLAGVKDKIARALARSFNWEIEFFSKTGKKVEKKGEKVQELGEKAMSDVLPKTRKGESEIRTHTFSYQNIYIWDGTNGEDLAEMLRSKGYTVWGGGLKAGMLEKDRINAKRVFEKLGIPTPAYEVAEDVDELIRVLRGVGDREVVLKSNYNLVPTYIGTGEELLDIVEENSEVFVKGKGFVVEEKKVGKEISCERYLRVRDTFGETECIEGMINFTIEAKKFLAGDYGIQTGAEFNLVFPLTEVENFALYTKNPQKVRRVLYKIAEYLYRTEQLSDVEILDINFIVDFENERVWALEFTPRIGYPGSITFAHLLHNNSTSWDSAIVEGKVGKLKGYSFGVRVSVPPYPYKRKQEDKDEDKNGKDLDFVDTEIEIEMLEDGKVRFAVDGLEWDDEDGCWYVMNTNLGVVNSYSQSISDDLFDRAYGFIKENIKGVIQVRVDGKEWLLNWLRGVIE